MFVTYMSETCSCGYENGWLSSGKSFRIILCIREFIPLFDSVFIENHPDVISVENCSDFKKNLTHNLSYNICYLCAYYLYDH